MKDVKIIKLETLGEPLSIKTIKQGRRKSLHKTVNNLPNISINNIVKTKYRDNSVLSAEANCKRILAYKNSTFKQKQVASKFLEELKNGSGNHLNYLRIIMEITRTFSLMDRKF